MFVISRLVVPFFTGELIEVIPYIFLFAAMDEREDITNLIICYLFFYVNVVGEPSIAYFGSGFAYR